MRSIVVVQEENPPADMTYGTVRHVIWIIFHGRPERGCGSCERMCFVLQLRRSKTVERIDEKICTRGRSLSRSVCVCFFLSVRREGQVRCSAIKSCSKEGVIPIQTAAELEKCGTGIKDVASRKGVSVRPSARGMPVRPSVRRGTQLQGFFLSDLVRALSLLRMLQNQNNAIV